MSEKKKKDNGVRHLPIFPLPLVLLPNELLPLHIFEDKYQKMLTDISTDGNAFGMILFEPTESFADRPETGSVGCVAEVRDSQPLMDGRSNIVVAGTDRFRLVEYIDGAKPYLVGEVELFNDDAADVDELDPLAEDVFRIFERVAKAAFKLSGNRGHFSEIKRTEPEPFSFLAAAAFNFENDLKYRLLEMTSTIERLEKLREILLKAADQMEANADIHQVIKTNGHGKKPPDL